jgi:galactofuranose transport system substrate-binding protein
MKLRLSGLICLGLILCLTGCVSDTKAEKVEKAEFVLGFSQLGSESGWRLGNTKSIIDAAENYGVDLIYLNAEQKQENQIAHIRRLIANQVDIIAYAPIITTGWDNVLMEAKEASIPIIVTDRSIITRR